MRCSDVGAVLGVVEGRGHAEFGEQEVALQERDLIVVPSRSRLVPRAETELVLFGYSDRAAQERLGLFREDRG